MAGFLAVGNATGAGAPPAARLTPTLDDFMNPDGAVDFAVSPNGRHLAGIIREKNVDVVLSYDTETGEQKIIARVGLKDSGPVLETHITEVYWKTDERILFRTSALPPDGQAVAPMWRSLPMFGMRLFSAKRDGTDAVRMLSSTGGDALDLAFDLASIQSLLPRDPGHILMIVDGIEGRSLMKVDVTTGKGELVERPRKLVNDWWLDLDGKPVVRVNVNRGTMTFYRREGSDDWKAFYRVRLKELKETQEYEPLGPSENPGKFYVLARPEGAERRGVYLYDIARAAFGAQVVEHPLYDISFAKVATDGTRILHYCYIADVEVCDSQDPRMHAYLGEARGIFRGSTNVFVADSSDDQRELLLWVDGPSNVPGYYLYHASTKTVSFIGYRQLALAEKNLPTAATVEYTTRDGIRLTGYLTLPPGITDIVKLPLVVFPHGGPESQDYLSFSSWVQFFASRGYAVFQTNFRGSDGFGRKFAESGHGQWGRKMQDDITDGIKLLIDRGTIDPMRICIVGASYGGYAALAGVAFTPEFYRCAVALSGPADLSEFLKYRRKMHGDESEAYAYWKRQIGDPETAAAQIAAISPALHVGDIKAPILLVHGDEDDIVPYEQSADLKKRLEKSGRKTELIKLAYEGHSDWAPANERRVLQAIDAFLEKHIGAGMRSY